jgi:hypothetical protein
MKPPHPKKNLNNNTEQKTIVLQRLLALVLVVGLKQIGQLIANVYLAKDKELL